MTYRKVDLEQMVERGRKGLKENRKLLALCFLSVFAWGLIAHAYVFFQSSFSHDSLMLFMDYDWRIALGKVFVPAYLELSRGALTLPWMIGILSLCYVGAAVFLMVKAFSICSRCVIVLLAGVFTANITFVSAAATYIHDLDAYMMALLMAVVSFFLWKQCRRGFWWGMIPLAICMGLYQSYVCVTITLILLASIMALLDGERFSNVFVKGLKGIGMILGAGAVYFVSMKAIMHFNGVNLYSGGYNSLDTVLSMSPGEIMQSVVHCYADTVRILLSPKTLYDHRFSFCLHALVLLIAGGVTVRKLLDKAIGGKEKALALVLIALLPLGMNGIYVITDGLSNDLLHFAIWLGYAAALLIVWRYVGRGNARVILRSVTLIAIAAILIGNIRMANTVYLKKDLEHKASVSLFTRIVDRMEQYDGYVTGETPVLFVGKPDTVLDEMRGFDKAAQITGAENAYALGAAERGYYLDWFEYVLLHPIKLVENAAWYVMQTDEAIASMPSYPAEGSIKMMDGTLVVKLGP